MLRLLKMALVAIVGAWSALRAAEESVAVWIRRSTRERDLSGLSWA